MNVERLAPLGLFLAEAKNYRATKHRQMLGLKITRAVEMIKKIREHELHRLEAMVLT